MKHNVYTLWASLRGQPDGPWMLAAEDEYSWEGDPDRCEKVFQEARNRCDENDLDYREITIGVEYSEIVKSFAAGTIEGEVQHGA